MKKQLTIVTPAYRSERYLRRYIANILSLVNKNEIIVKLILNDASEEEREIVDSLDKNDAKIIDRIYIQRESIAASINRGFGLAETEFLAYADVDDLRPADSYQRMLNTLHAAEVTYGDYKIVARQGSQVGNLIELKEFSKDIAVREPLYGPGHCFRREVLNKVGYWDEQLRSSGDYDWQIRSAYRCEVKKTPGLITFYTKDGVTSASQTNLHRIENLLLNLRYGIYDKAPPYLDCLPEISNYDIFNILINGEYYSVANFIDGYVELLKQNRNKIYAGYGFRRISSIFFKEVIKRIID